MNHIKDFIEHIRYLKIVGGSREYGLVNEDIHGGVVL